MTTNTQPVGKYDAAIAELNANLKEIDENVSTLEEALKSEKAEKRDVLTTLAKLKKLNGESDTPEADNAAE